GACRRRRGERYGSGVNFPFVNRERRDTVKSLLIALAVVVFFAGSFRMAEGHAVETMSAGGDNLKIKKTYKDGFTIKFCVSKSRDAAGFKTLKLFDNVGKGIALIEVSDSAPGPVCASFKRQDLLEGFRFELFKRKYLLVNSFLSGTDVAYYGASPLARMDFHWINGD
ncbi:MAG: hypothetical protein Q8O19_07430, partial [Rectinemataceae bacterium]|nr:hypothetical protein [Rectinemataceae bacterium]